MIDRVSHMKWTQQGRNLTTICMCACLCMCMYNGKIYALNCISFFSGRLESEDSIEENRKNLMILTQKVFNAIVESAERYD